jgi:hypothetical protein
MNVILQVGNHAFDLKNRHKKNLQKEGLYFKV